MPRAPDYQKERGLRQEERILASLSEKPKTSDALAKAICTGRSNIEVYMRRMRKAGKIYISAHEKRNGRPAPVWAVGNEKNIEYVPNKRPSPVQSVAERLVIVRELLKEGNTSRELAAKLNVTKGRAQRYIILLREQAPEGKKVVYIAGWRHPGKRGDLAPIYKMGSKDDAKKPKETRAQRYAKEKACPETYDRILSKNRVRHAIARAKSKPQGIFAALGL